jgi:hypothetical protein
VLYPAIDATKATSSKEDPHRPRRTR